MSDEKQNEPTEERIKQRGKPRNFMGRPLEEPTRRISVPLSIADSIEQIIKEYKNLQKRCNRP